MLMSENPLCILNLSGWSASEESLNEVAEFSVVLEEGNDYLMADVREECENYTRSGTCQTQGCL